MVFSECFHFLPTLSIHRKSSLNKSELASVDCLTASSVDLNNISFGSYGFDLDNFDSHSALFQDYKDNRSRRNNLDNKQKAKPFVEAHKLPELGGKCSRFGVRYEGDLFHAHIFTELLFGDKEELCKTEITSRLKSMDFSPVESSALAEIFCHNLKPMGCFKVKKEILLIYLAYFMEKAEESKSEMEFGFAFVDQNSDGKISLPEMETFLELFWNKKLENILKTKDSKSFLSSFMKRQGASDSFNFYLDMKKMLNHPYIDAEDFEDIKDKYIKEGAPEELNLSYELRKSVLDYNEVDGMDGFVKSSVLREVTVDIGDLLQQKVDLINTEQEEIRALVYKLWTQTVGRQSLMTKYDFRDFLRQHKTLFFFVADVQKLFMKVRKVSEDDIESKRSLSDME